MKVNLGSKSYEMTANQKAIAGLTKFLSALIIVGVVFFCEIMYLSIVTVAFPDGLFRALASFGAMAGGLSVLVLLLGKMYWFPEGGQAVASWAFTGVEMLVLVLNVLLAFQLKTEHIDTFLNIWLAFSPASPIIALVGWVGMWMLDGSTKSRHAQLAQEQKEHESSLRFQSSVHTAQMELQHTMLDSHTQYLMEYANSTELQNEIRIAARKLARENLSILSGMNVVARLGNNEPASTNFVDSTLAGATDTWLSHHAKEEKSTTIAGSTLADATLAQTGTIAVPASVQGVPTASTPDATPEDDTAKGRAGRLHNNPTVQEMLEEWNRTGDVPAKWNSKSMISRMRNKYGTHYPGIMPTQA